MELRHLRYFTAVAEGLHFTRAARRLRVAQPALSKQVRDLEAELGVALFRRERQRVTLTAAGESFLRDAREVLAAVERAAEGARRAACGQAGQLRIGYLATLAPPALSSALRALRRSRPEVQLSLSDLPPAQQIAKKYGAQAVSNNSIFDIDVDIYSPCAFGGTINTKNIDKLKCAIIAGSANNQLEDEHVHGQMLLDKGILFAPDYVINAGGVINCYSELMGFGKARTMELTENIYEATRNVLKLSKAENISTIEAANKIAEKRIADIRKVKSSY